MTVRRLMSGPLAALLAGVLLLAGCGDALDGAADRSGGGGAASPAAPPPTNESVTPGDDPASAGDAAASGATPRAVTRAPALGLRAIPGTYEEPLYLATRPGDRNRLYIVEKAGRVRVVRNGHLLSRPFLDLSSQVSTISERGLLSIAFDPRHRSNRFVYAYYTDLAGAIKVVRYRTTSNGQRVLTGTRRQLLSIPHPAGNHNGGQLQFGHDGRLYAGTGDGGGAGDPERDALDPRSRQGKLLRTNPRVARPTWQVYALGLRNPWRFSFDRATGDLWLGDVGQGDREEIDFLPARTPRGANFGWNAYEGSLPYDPQGVGRDGLTFPVYEYGRDAGTTVTGGYVYRGRAIPALRGFYLFADFGSGRFWAMAGPGAEPERIGFSRSVDLPASFGQDAAGELYVVSLAGRVYRIVRR